MSEEKDLAQVVRPVTATDDETLHALTQLVGERLAAAADPHKAVGMAAYMKSDMPCYGVQKAGRVPIQRAIKGRFPPADRAGWQAAVRALWAMPRREEKYLALGYARSFPSYLDAASLPLYEQLIREGAWWDFVDEVAVQMLGRAWQRDRAAVTSIMEHWIDDEDRWIRRSAIIGQLKHKGETDVDLLFAFCLRRADEREFFIRKAIGWALREYAKTAPDAVRAFLAEHGDALSPLSRREASKHL